MFVAKADELKGITAIDEYFVRAQQQPGGAQGSGTRPHPVGAGGSDRGYGTVQGAGNLVSCSYFLINSRGQATLSVAQTSHQQSPTES